MLMAFYQNSWQNDTEIIKETSENVSKFRYLEMTVTNQN
jgi:hypothetical protein